MQHRAKALLILITIVGFYSCTTLFPKKTVVKSTDDGKLEAVFIQVNDVYEIAPLSNGKSGGMARVAELKKKYKKNNPNTYLVMAGDFLSPSVYNSLKYQDKQIRGKQMVEAMNAAAFDFVTFGNHEFDLKEKELQERLDESQFMWISSNCFHKQKGVSSSFTKKNGNDIVQCPKTYILTMNDADGTQAKIGFFGITLPFNKADYVGYIESLSTAKSSYLQLKDSCDAVIAITHQSVEEDERLAKEIPGLAAIIGGHEHDMRFVKSGNLYITKAHANARSAYIITIAIDKKLHSVQVSPELKEIDESVAFDSATNVVVKKWMDIADASYVAQGFNSKQIVLSSGEALDGRETEVRSKSTALTKLVTKAMMQACPQADAVLLNSGSIRVDDVLFPPISQYDILRSLPFGGPIKEADMKGRLLMQVLDAGKKNTGNGGFLQYGNIAFNEVMNTWTINNAVIHPDKTYRIAMADFLLTGKEANLGFLNPQNPEIVKVYDTPSSIDDPRSDIRLAIIRYLQHINN